MQQWRDEVSLDTEIRLKSKDGKHNTSVRSKVGVSWTEIMERECIKDVTLV